MRPVHPLILRKNQIYDPRFDSGVQGQRAEDGSGTLLIRVRNYNGKPNDDSVTVSLHPSGGLNDDPCNAENAKPHWDGTDSWPIDTSSLEPLQGTGGGPTGAGTCGGGATGYDYDDPVYVDTSAYVTGSTLVAALPLELVLGDAGASSSVTIKQGFLAGHLETQSNGWHLVDATLAGRWPVADLFATLGSLTIQGAPLRTDNLVFGQVKQTICSYLDITAELAPPTSPCDAMSMGMLFSAQQAKLGLVVPSVEPPSWCPPETDPAGQTCE